MDNVKSQTLKILMIDDNLGLTEIMCELISLLGHNTISASNGPEGILKAKEFHPDVIICDIGLPVMNGYEIAKIIRSDIEIKNVYLIALSGYVGSEDIDYSRKMGFNMHLCKPVDISTIERILNDVTKNRFKN